MSGARRWYGEGLQFQCAGCGRCCRGPGGYVWLSVKEAEALACRLGMTVDDFGRRYLRRTGSRLALVDKPGGDCIFLDDEGGCTVYEDRPTQCRTFPWWPEVLESRRAWNREKRNCPGLGEGPTHQVEQIEQTLAQNDEEE